MTIHQRHRQTDRRTDRQTDRQTTCDRNTALCTKVHRAVKMLFTRNIRFSFGRQHGVLVGLTRRLVALFCVYVVPSTSTRVRLSGGLNDREGFVQVFFQGHWGTICDDGWTVFDAAVVCRMLGFTYVKILSISISNFVCM